MIDVTENFAERLLAPALLAVSTAALGLAFVTQYGFKLEPCTLCLYQRIPYGITAGLGFLAMTLPGARLDAVAVIAGLIFAAGGALAIYHVGVEQHWWQAATVCAGGGDQIGDLRNVSDLRAALFARRPVPCDIVAWSLFGLSMAVYNAVLSWALAMAAFLAACAIVRQGRL